MISASGFGGKCPYFFLDGLLSLQAKHLVQTAFTLVVSPFPIVVLRNGEFRTGFSRVHESLVVPFGSAFLQCPRDNDALFPGVQGVIFLPR